MNIIFLHLHQGLVDRGLERVVDLYGTELCKNHTVTILQSGPDVAGKPYAVKRLFPLSTPPQAAPQNLFEKLLFRLELDPNSLAVRDFTKEAIPLIKKLNPEIIIACNGATQVRLLRATLPTLPLAVFGAAGLGHDDIKTLLAGPDLYIALTQVGADWAKQFKRNQTKLVVIPNPVVINKPKMKSKLALPKPIVLTVGALTHYKHIVDLAESIIDLPVSHVIIGDGEEAGVLQRVLSSRAFDFRWIRHVEPVDLPNYYAQADVFCFTPDSREAFGNVYIEAMASSLPIVATDDPVRREIIGPKGFYVKIGDKQALRDAIVNAANQGKTDYSKELKSYDVKTVTKQLESVLYDLIKK